MMNDEPFRILCEAYMKVQAKVLVLAWPVAAANAYALCIPAMYYVYRYWIDVACRLREIYTVSISK